VIRHQPIEGPPPPSVAGTLIMATRNRCARAESAVEQALALPEKWPIIVVDDASDDATSTTLRRRFGGAVDVVTLRRNEGASARNHGVAAASTPLVGFFDDDSYWLPGSLDRAARIMAAHPQVGLVAGQVTVDTDQRIDEVSAAMSVSPLPPWPAGPAVLGFMACAVVVRRSAYLSVGGFSPLLHVGGEEELLAIDLRDAGWMLTYVDAVRIRHEPKSADAGRSSRQATLLRNEMLVALMRRPPRRVVKQAVELLARTPHDADARRAVMGVMRRLPQACAARRRIGEQVELELRLLEHRRR
jgi:GT2 family glycosyltransferase